MLPSWEDIVKRVTIQSNYYNVGDAAEGWRRAFGQIDELRGQLQDLLDRSDSWKGGAADAFRDHLKKHIKNMQNLADDHRKIVQALESARDHLATAVSKIQIPSWMIGDVESQQAAYHSGQQIPGWPEGSFAHGYLDIVGGGILTSDSNPLSGAMRGLEKWVSDGESKARQAYSELCSHYANDQVMMPQAQAIQAPGVQDGKEFPPGGGGGGFGGGGGGLGGGAGGLGAGGLPGGGMKLPPGGGYHAPDGIGGTDPYGSLTPPGSGSFDPNGTGPDLGTGGLAGAVPGGLSGLNSGTGLSPLGGGGLGGAGGGLGGLGGRGLPPVGPATSPTGMLSGMGGMGAGAGAGAGRGGGRGAGGRGARAGSGMMGGGHGGQGGADDGRSTWLTEDDDVWGSDGDAAPRLIGG